jgi:hypothetical protein
LRSRTVPIIVAPKPSSGQSSPQNRRIGFICLSLNIRPEDHPVSRFWSAPTSAARPAGSSSAW